MMDDITIARTPLGRVYYYQGNIFMPLELPREIELRVRRLVDLWRRDNADLIKDDRAQPEYRNLLQLAGFA